MRGVILAGGTGTRLLPLTRQRNKHLLPVAGVPMIVHPLRRLVEAGLVDVLVVSSPEGATDLARELGSGQSFGARLSFRVQDEPRGIADALLHAHEFAAEEPCVVILGDNLFTAPLAPLLAAWPKPEQNALVLLSKVEDPERYGVARFDGPRLVEIIEKPTVAPSALAVTGIYGYPPDFAERASRLEPSGRGELEITDLNASYLADGRLAWTELEGLWLDAGTLEAYERANRLFSEQ